MENNVVNKKILNLIGIARRAGKVVTGEDIILSAIKKNKVRFLLIASDTGSSVYKKFNDKAKFYKIPTNCSFNKAQISDAIGMQRTILGINDLGFSKKLSELTMQNNEKGT
ncbi:L7Ae/L30e/S12e/Gadd45 family ribosomal protein [Apilactobacillus xinyiensis]|jgi:ribosomal protein L7Ae-like RNA K-turn-binding protein|uniref:Ribosomal L7Ae/L30e/S12e/Gadd45 family protein n=1 Tax=Apilactobacillus xinyiensis TaxID=2841032 RepID=A0ABT0HZM2_9LACO|nr:ribosomal L7Ae/L30e/S12e/Gadd45 family protein [Apilactobacillus xinyiensis]MCK8624030.1 ribosomal L7Ae/L30e/S12e/Gadd45 family protein [Apilactobacillus xinyiensis]MCL0318233.1 ribosomal L7Ae/L30e/S12e/Gadd45 family protein [Apilactobacillus xinyiensis]